jgi:Barstar (barnase inhibitor)
MGVFDLMGPWLELQPQMPQGHEMALPESSVGWTLANIGNQRVAIRKLRGSKMTTLGSLWDEFGGALQFPWDFAETWTALADCLRDLSWLPADAYILAIFEPEKVLCDENPKEFLTFLRCLDGAGRAWSTADVSKATRDRRAKPFHSIFNCSPYDVERLSSRLEAANVGHLVRPVRL